MIADTKTPELDYENSAGNEVTTKYTGTGGVKAGSLLTRAAFALRFGDPNFILSSQITKSSKVMYIRNIVSRAEKAAPFLKFDSDPYAVVLNGQRVLGHRRLHDHRQLPLLAERRHRPGPSASGLNSTFNYVRNSVKVVISAYNGSMRFFVVDPTDPIIQVYEKAFPDLFTPVSQGRSDLPWHRGPLPLPGGPLPGADQHVRPVPPDPGPATSIHRPRPGPCHRIRAAACWRTSPRLRRRP